MKGLLLELLSSDYPKLHKCMTFSCNQLNESGIEGKLAIEGMYA